MNQNLVAVINNFNQSKMVFRHLLPMIILIHSSESDLCSNLLGDLITFTPQFATSCHLANIFPGVGVGAVFSVCRFNHWPCSHSKVSPTVCCVASTNFAIYFPYHLPSPRQLKFPLWWPLSHLLLLFFFHQIWHAATSLGSGSPLLSCPQPGWEDPASWNYLDTRGDERLDTITCRVKRPGEAGWWHDTQTLLQAAQCPLLTSPIWLPSDPSSWPGGFHLQTKLRWLPPRTSWPWIRCKAQSALVALSQWYWWKGHAFQSRNQG